MLAFFFVLRYNKNMSYQALYRKYRPKTFDGLIGQNHITDTLANQIQAGKLFMLIFFVAVVAQAKLQQPKFLQGQ